MARSASARERPWATGSGGPAAGLLILLGAACAWVGPAAAGEERAGLLTLALASPAQLDLPIEVRHVAPTEQRRLVTSAVVRDGPTVEARILGLLPVGAVVDVDARTADALFLHVRPADRAVPAGWIWAPLVGQAGFLHGADEEPAKAPNSAPADDAPPRMAGDLKRYRQHFHAVLASRGLDPLGRDSAAAIGAFRDLVRRVRESYVRPIDVTAFIDAAIKGLDVPPPPPGEVAGSPRELMLASVRTALAGLDGQSTIVTSEALETIEAPVPPDDSKDAQTPAESEPDNDGTQDMVLMQLHFFRAGVAAEARDIIERRLALAESHGHAIHAIIVDLRGNPGGRLKEALDFVDLFIDGGELGRIVTDRPGRYERLSLTAGELLAGVPMLVLVDGSTDAVAELAAGALQLSGRALLVGQATGGMATVQTVSGLVGGGALSLTTGELTLAGGRRFACVGLTPDIRTGRAGIPLGALGDRSAGCADAASLLFPERRSCPVPGASMRDDPFRCAMRALATFVLAPPDH